MGRPNFADRAYNNAIVNKVLSDHGLPQTTTTYNFGGLTTGFRAFLHTVLFYDLEELHMYGFSFARNEPGFAMKHIAGFAHAPAEVEQSMILQIAEKMRINLVVHKPPNHATYHT